MGGEEKCVTSSGRHADREGYVSSEKQGRKKKVREKKGQKDRRTGG